MCAASVSLYLGHPQACQYKNFTMEDIRRIYVASCLQLLFFIMLKHRI